MRYPLIDPDLSVNVGEKNIRQKTFKEVTKSNKLYTFVYTLIDRNKV